MLKNIILFPHKLGQLKNGVEKTPKLLNCLLKNKNNNFYYVKCGSTNMYSNLLNLYNMNDKINEPKINIGGDHSMSIATVANSLNKNKDLKVIWFDAHADINTRQSSLTNNYHGMGLSFLTGLDKDKKFNYIDKLLPFKNLLYIGVRDVDKFEQNIINEHNLNIITVNNIRNDLDKSIKQINNFIGNNKIHISFDVDVMDPSVVYSTGTPVDNGLLLDETIEIFNKLNDKNLVNMDLTELNLNIGAAIGDKDFDSFSNVIKILHKYIY
jgi:arginase